HTVAFSIAPASAPIVEHAAPASVATSAVAPASVPVAARKRGCPCEQPITLVAERNARPDEAIARIHSRTPRGDRHGGRCYARVSLRDPGSCPSTACGVDLA